MKFFHSHVKSQTMACVGGKGSSKVENNWSRLCQQACVKPFYGDVIYQNFFVIFAIEYSCTTYFTSTRQWVHPDLKKKEKGHQV